MRNSKSDLKGVKLSTLCLEVSWVRANDGVLCIQPLGHEGDHISDMESYGGKGDQNLHDEPSLLPHFQYLLADCVDDLSPLKVGDRVRVVDFKDPNFGMDGEITVEFLNENTLRVKLIDCQTRFAPSQLERL
jgi:hypothetical protein